MVAGLTAFLLSAGQLLIWRPPIGLADNGDYQRLLCQLGQRPALAPGLPAYFESVPFRYQPRPPGAHCLGYRSTELPILRAAKWISEHLLGLGGLDLRVVGLIHAVILGVLVWLVVRALPGPRLFRGGTALVLIGGVCDTAFVAYFSSAYSEPMSMLGVLALLAAALHAWRYSVVPPGWLLCVAGATLVLISTKTQNGPLAVVASIALSPAGARWDDGEGRSQPGSSRPSWASSLCSSRSAT